MPDRLTLDEISLLIQNGDISQENLQALFTADPDTGKMAFRMLMQNDGIEVQGPGMGLAGLSAMGVGKGLDKAISAGSKIPAAMKGMGGVVGGLVGGKVAHPWIGAKL